MRHVFCLQVWLHAPYELHLSLFEHFIELLTESRWVSLPRSHPVCVFPFLIGAPSARSEAAKNARLLREFQLVPRLLLTLRDASLSQPTVAAISNVLSLLLQGFPNPYDLLRSDPRFDTDSFVIQNKSTHPSSNAT